MNSFLRFFTGSLFLLLTHKASTQPLDSRILGDYKARMIGPSVMSGRVSCIEGVNKRPSTLLIGTAGGGVWKTLDYGVTVKPVFEKHNQSIGAIAIDQDHPDTIWAGTGETWTRNSVSVGDGIYRSTDGGDSWKKMGLEKSERISRIIIHPTNKNIVYAAVPGALFNDSEERGLFQTTDGGSTWKKILYVDAKTGCADIAMDPSDPNTLYATTWEFRRKAWSFQSGGKGSAIYKSSDGGATWKKLSKGLPAGDMGRIAIVVSPADPKVVYATIEYKESAMFRSNDKGESWERTGTSAYIIERPFYFSKLIADPKDPNRVYRAGLNMMITTDGGKSFSSLRGGAHSDHHDLWINPRDPESIVLATDGGIYISHDRGAHFFTCRNLPVGQFYHVAVDDELDYNVYGGLQDNGSWMGKGRTNTGSISNRDWYTVGYGDGFWVVPDPSDNNYVYWESQGGALERFYKPTKTSKSIKPLELAGQPRYRYNWNSPIGTSPTNKNRIYYAAQFLFMSEDKGESWKKISPDLTTNDPAKQQQEESGGITYDNSSAENHCTIFSIAESPRNEKTIWVGTDDGNIQLTRDGGNTWTLVSKGLPGLPAPYWISSIEPMRDEDGGAYVTIDGHMWGDMESYVYKTLDFGKTWKRIGQGQIKGYTHVIREDLVNRKLLFLGTEFGLFLSFDQGENFVQMDHNNNVPNVAVRDIRIQSHYHDLVLATHGRGIMIIDDISPLRILSSEILAKPIHIFEPEPYAVPENGSDFFAFGDDEYTALNPRSGFTVKYYLQKKLMTGDFYVDVCDMNGKKIISQILGKRKGLNFVEVPLSSPPPKMPPGPRPAFAGFIPAPLPEGEYKLRFVKDKDTLWSKVNLIYQQRSIHSKEDKQIRHDFIARTHKLCNDFSYTVMSATNLRDQANAMASRPECAAAKKQLVALAATLDALHARVVSTKEGMIADDGKFLRDRISTLYGQIVGYNGRPSKTQTDKTETFEKEVAELEKELNGVLLKQLPSINKQLSSAKQPILERMPREKFEAMK